MESLQFLIDELSCGRKFHISILDLSGILTTRTTKIKFKNIVHINDFCNIAKSTSIGYRVCQHCKMLANTRSIQEKKSFGGHCLHGLFEVANPVVIDDRVMAIVYVGNAMIDEQKSTQIINQVCKYTGVSSSKLCDELKKCEPISTPNELFKIANLVSDYMTVLYANASKQKTSKPIKKMNWLVSMMKNHADEMYRTEITLTELAETYQKNEKYMGRLFKKEMGVSFAEYKRQKRLELAESLILQSNDKIIDIAFECGFNNISYFNREFRSKHGCSPNEYRAQNRTKTNS